MRHRARLWLPMLAAIGMAGSGLALAHHSAAEWDMSRRISISGVVKVVQFRNPHGHLELTVTDAKGVAADWDVETSSMAILIRRGWKVGSVKPGETLAVSGHLPKSGGNRLYMREMKTADGKVFGDPEGKDTALD